MSFNEQDGRHTEELTGRECWKLLASVPLGRVVFSQQALPAIRVVRHVVEEDMIIMRSPPDAMVTGRVPAGAQPDDRGAVVAYEADEMNAEDRLGWSVVVTGIARAVRDPAEVARYTRDLGPWTADDAGPLIAIEPRVLTGRRLVP